MRSCRRVPTAGLVSELTHAIYVPTQTVEGFGSFMTECAIVRPVQRPRCRWWTLRLHVPSLWRMRLAVGDALGNPLRPQATSADKGGGLVSVATPHPARRGQEADWLPLSVLPLTMAAATKASFTPFSLHVILASSFIPRSRDELPAGFTADTVSVRQIPSGDNPVYCQRKRSAVPTGKLDPYFTLLFQERLSLSRPSSSVYP